MYEKILVPLDGSELAERAVRVQGGIEAEIKFDLNDKETQFLNDQPVGDGKMYGSELIERILHGPQCLFDVSGDLSGFLEVFLWIGLDLGPTEIALFETSKRFVDEVIAEFDWECIHKAPSDIADLTLVPSGGAAEPDLGVLTLRYSGSDSDGAHTYSVDVLEVGEDLTFAKLMENGYLDTEYYTRAQGGALRAELASLRTEHSGEEVIVVTTGLHAELFLASQVDVLVANGTPGADRYNLKRLNGRVGRIEINGGSGNNVILLTGDSTNTAPSPETMPDAGFPARGSVPIGLLRRLHAPAATTAAR